MTEELRSGIEAVETVTALLQRSRNAHPSAGLYEAAELQFWWNKPRRSDDLDQLFWIDGDSQPEAAALMIDFTGGGSLLYSNVTFCPFVLPGASAEQIEHVLERGLAHAAANGFATVELEVGSNDEVMKALLDARGFTMADEKILVECRMLPEDRTSVSELHEDYTLTSRAQASDRPHHMSDRAGAEIEQRLNELSLYRPDLDLAVYDKTGAVGGYGMFWFDPVTTIGVVEPMRTHDDHQQRGLARHILTAGLDLLVQAGATKLAIGYEPDNPASGHLYRSVGFEPIATTDLYSGPTS